MGCSGHPGRGPHDVDDVVGLGEVHAMGLKTRVVGARFGFDSP